MEGESVQQFVAALKKLSLHCNFGSYLQTALCNQVVFGLRSKRIQSSLLEMRDLTFEKAVEIATSMELSEKDVHQLQAGSLSVGYVNQKETGTFRKNNSGTSKTFHREEAFSTSAPAKPKRHTVNSGQVLPPILCIQNKHQEFRRKYSTMLVNKVPVRFKIDSGTAVTIASKQFLEKHFPDVQLKPSKLQLITFCRTIPVVGYIEAYVHYKDYAKRLHMYVSETSRNPLLGREWIRQFKVQLTDNVFFLNTPIEKEVDIILR